MRIAVAGAGFQGACIALELSRRGCRVDLFDRAPVAISKAGFGNEGKIHLGLVYAMDTSHRTVNQMLRGALCFADLLGRWIDFPDDGSGVSTPFYYAVHRTGQAPFEAISSHFARVQSLYTAMRDGTGLRYLHRDEPRIYMDITDRPEAKDLNLEHFSGVFATTERAVDPERIAQELRRRIDDEESVSFIGNTFVKAATIPERGDPVLEYIRGGVADSEPYDHIINALWAGKLELDRTVYGLPKRPWIFRNKLGMVVRKENPPRSVPSLTMILGSYGDIVNYGDGSFYLSWYPICMVEKSFDVSINDWETYPDTRDKTRIMDQTVSSLAEFCPGVRELECDGQRHLKGGTIFAWGESDIEDVNSELHNRYDIGIESRDRYHSVNTGKYTMAPFYAVELADRILGESTTRRLSPS